MRIYIPTRGRPDKQIFYNALPSDLQKCCHFVCNTLMDVPTAVRGDPKRFSLVKAANIGEKRAAIVKLHNPDIWGPELVMCDDDLRLNVRRSDDPAKFSPMRADGAHYRELFELIYTQLDNYAHVTVMPREGGNRKSVDQECGRAMRILGYNHHVLIKEGADFTRCPTKEDFDVTLQLLRAGHKNLIIAGFVQDDGGGSNAAGGCSIYRDQVYMEETARRLHSLHPQFVKIVQKTTKGAWGGGTRTDVIIQWKAAWESSKCRA